MSAPMNITMTGPVDEAPPVWEMVVIHRIFRRGFRLVAGLVRRTPDGALHRAGPIASHVEFLLNGLHAHHTSEDDHLWPKLLERAAPRAELIERMERQHAAVGEHEDRVRLLLDRWRRAAERPVAVELAAELTALTGALVEHLDEEEASLLPLVSMHITGAEWAEMAQASFDKFPRSALPIMLGQMLEAATPEEAAGFLAKLPAPVRLGWRVAGRRRYARYIRRVRGGYGPVATPLLRRANKLAVALYRRSGGRIGGSARGLRVMLMTVPGRRTGTPHTVPIVYFEHADGYLVVGSSGGSKAEPQWCRNIRVASQVIVQIGHEEHVLTPRVPGEEERDRLWRDVVLGRAAFFAKYERKAGRILPIAVLCRGGG